MTTVSIEEAPVTDQQILAQLRELDPFSRRELLDFLEFLRYQKQPGTKPVVAVPTVKNPTAMLLESGVVGCAEADPSLSRTYKTELSKSMDQWFGQFYSRLKHAPLWPLGYGEIFLQLGAAPYLQIIGKARHVSLAGPYKNCPKY